PRAVTELIIATRNSHKVEEIQAVLPQHFSCRTLKDFPDAPAVDENQPTFTGNATKKAVELARWLAGKLALVRSQSGGGKPSVEQQKEGHSKRYALADDSGLEVDALKGAPGFHSARFANLDSGDAGNASD